MTLMKKVVGGVGVAAVLVVAAWGAWRIRPLSAARTTWREGDRLVTETRTRSFQLLPRRMWGYGRVTANAGGPTSKLRADGVVVGFFEVIDQWEQTSAPAPE